VNPVSDATGVASPSVWTAPARTRDLIATNDTTEAKSKTTRRIRFRCVKARAFDVNGGMVFITLILSSKSFSKTKRPSSAD